LNQRMRAFLHVEIVSHFLGSKDVEMTQFY
jgi:hypothetical protein